MWEIDLIHPDPFIPRDSGRGKKSKTPDVAVSYIVSAATPIISFLGNKSSALSSFHEGGKGSCVALADFASRYFLGCQQRNGTTETIVVNESENDENISLRMETLDEALLKTRQRKNTSQRLYPPYVVERSDFFCCNDSLRITVRVIVRSTSNELFSKERVTALVPESCQAIFRKVFPVDDPAFSQSLLEHVACVVLQQKLRSHLSSIDAIAFISNGSILPRKSGASATPMASPPAVPFKAPTDSRMSKSICIDIGSLIEYVSCSSFKIENTNKSTIVLSGLVVQQGVTLICGGGYHGE